MTSLAAKRLVLLAGAVMAALLSAFPCLAGEGIVWTGEPVKIACEGCYARVLRVGESRWMAVFEDTRGNVVASESNNGRDWSPGMVVFPWYMENSVRVNAANAELCILCDGTLLCAANYRPSSDGAVPFSIAVSRSVDGGNSWSAPDLVYEAGKSFRDGCWEPSFLELPDGTVHLYFADEGPFIHSREQRISFIASDDGGKNWSSPAPVCFRPFHRDGMPVAAIFGDEIVVAIEDDADGNFKPYTVRTSLSAPWDRPVYGDSPFRGYALSSMLDPSGYAGAPYLIRLPDGRSLLSFQFSEDGKLSSACMEVAVGDTSARDFVPVQRPFGDAHALWNSLAVWDGDTVVAVATASLDGLAPAPWIRFGLLSR